MAMAHSADMWALGALLAFSNLVVHAHDQKGFRDLHNDACKKLHNPEILATVNTE